MTATYQMNPIYAARIARVTAESACKAVERDPNSTVEQRVAARETLRLAKASYRAAFKQARADA